MFIVILFIFAGMAVGYAVRNRHTAWVPQCTTLLVWLLLLLIGMEVGADEHIMHALPTLGLEALAIAACATLGSCTAAWLLWRHIKSDKKGGARA